MLSVTPPVNASRVGILARTSLVTFNFKGFPCWDGPKHSEFGGVAQ